MQCDGSVHGMRGQMLVVDGSRTGAAAPEPSYYAIEDPPSSHPPQFFDVFSAGPQPVKRGYRPGWLGVRQRRGCMIRPCGA